MRNLQDPDQFGSGGYCFIKIGKLDWGNIENNWGGFFALHEHMTESSGNSSTLIGVAFIDGAFRHAANFVESPIGPMSKDTTFWPHVRRERWYKIDIFINWEKQVYEIRVDDVVAVVDAPFQGSKVSLVGLYNYHSMTTWFDEVYVGPEDTMGFQCPVSLSAGEELHMKRPTQTGWNVADLGPESSEHEIIRHSSHVSDREVYQHNAGGLVFGDGQPHVAFNSDIKRKTSDGDHVEVLYTFKLVFFLFYSVFASTSCSFVF